MTFKSLIIFLVSLFICEFVHAQSLYYFKYSFGKNENKISYKAMLIRYDDGNDSLRVHFQDEKKATANYKFASRGKL